MAVDAELLERAEAGQPGRRVYGWDGPWVSLGRSQDPERDLVPDCPIPSVKRPTGGGGVLHGHDVTFAMACPLADLGLDPRSARAGYRRIVMPLIRALRDAGIDAGLGADLPGERAKVASSDCFAAVADADVVDLATGRKVCGCALRLTRTAILLQASIPVEAPLVSPASVFAKPALVAPLDVDVDRLIASLA